MTALSALNAAIALFGLAMLAASFVRRERQRQVRADWLTWSQQADVSGVLSGSPVHTVPVDSSGRSPHPARRTSAAAGQLGDEGLTA
ncbi:hypothetical protein ABFT23_09635 [Nocardioides sp. C4-1]|uniref:hypothetical protein n=1 Tax=Nocardioides sp. C4-1 TaxID=3151851 RepID=UPI00326755B8